MPAIAILFIFLAVFIVYWGFVALIWLFKASTRIIGALLFNPKLNSILGIFYFLLIAMSLFEPIAIILSAIAIADCVRDAVLANVVYSYSYKYNVYDKKYIKKSILSFFTFGYIRVIYAVIIYPIIYGKIKADVKRKISNREPLLYRDNNYSFDMTKKYYYSKLLRNLEKRGELVSNKETVVAEIKMIQERLNKLYPKKRIEVLVDKIAGDREAKAIREESADKLSYLRLREACGEVYAYIPASVYKKFPDNLSEAMSDKGTMSLAYIIKLKEVEEVTHPLVYNSSDDQSAQNNREWIYYFFIIQALKALVEDGIFEDNNLNDRDPFETHAYRYTQSTKQPVSINANDNPMLALDD